MICIKRNLLNIIVIVIIMDHYIYTLTDFDGNPFYVGQTNNPTKRYKRHIYDAKQGGKFYVHNKIRKMLRENLGIDIQILESNINDQNINKQECFWIAHLRAKGVKLCNTATGGSFGMTPEMQKAAGEKRRGQKKSEITKKRISETKKGKPLSQAHCKALSKAWSRTEEQLKNQAIKSSKTSKGKINIGLFQCTDPNGKKHITHQGLTVFCEQHNLTIANMSKVVHGQRKHHKGWTIKKIQQEDATNGTNHNKHT